MACRYSPAMTLERGERIEVVGLQRKKQASNPILKKFSRVKKLCGRFFYALSPSTSPHLEISRSRFPIFYTRFHHRVWAFFSCIRPILADRKTPPCLYSVYVRTFMCARSHPPVLLAGLTPRAILCVPLRMAPTFPPAHLATFPAISFWTLSQQ